MASGFWLNEILQTGTLGGVAYGAAYWPTGGDHEPDPTFRPKLTAAQHDLDEAVTPRERLPDR